MQRFLTFKGNGTYIYHHNLQQQTETSITALLVIYTLGLVHNNHTNKVNTSE